MPMIGASAALLVNADRTHKTTTFAPSPHDVEPRTHVHETGPYNRQGLNTGGSRLDPHMSK